MATVNHQGVLTFETGGSVRNSLSEVNIGARPVTFGRNVWAANTKLKHIESVLKVGNGVTITGNVLNTSTENNKGTLTFVEIGGVTGNIGGAGGAEALEAVNIGAGVVTLGGHVWAKNTNLTHVNSVLNVEDTKTINGNIVNTTAENNKGTLNFVGDGEVTGDIGTIDAANPVNDKRLAQININAAGKDVILRGNVYTNELNFVAASTVKIGGNFAGGVDFDQPALGAVNGILEFNGVAGPYTFNSTILHGDHGTLNVKTANFKATHQDIGKIKTINIGVAGVGGNKTLTIDASNGNVNLLGIVNAPVLPAVNQEIKFSHASSVLHLYSNTASRIITFANNLPGGGGNVAAISKGIVLLEGAAGNTLTVSSVGVGGKTLGTAASILRELQVRGKVTITGDDVGVNNKLDVRNAAVLKIIKGATFTDESTTSAQIASVIIGETDGADAGKATYILDAKHTNFDILAGGKIIIFRHADAQLTLRNSDAGNKTITLQNNLNPGADNKGVVEFNSAGAELKIDGAAKSLGIVGRKLKKVIFSG